MGDPENSGKCVLIIEDNPLNMKLFSAMLTAQGYGVFQAGDALRGLDLAHREYPDLIVMDVNLPGMSGLEATQLLKEDPDTADIPIIITTAYEMHGDDEEIRASGCDGFIAKPIGLTEFVDLIDAVMARTAGEPRYVRRLVAAHAGG